MIRRPPAALTNTPVTWQWRYSAVVTDCDYRLEQSESGDVGCVATSAKRNLTGNAPSMTALVEVTRQHRAPKVGHCLPPLR